MLPDTGFLGDSLYKMSKPIFWEKLEKSISEYRLLNVLPSMLSFKMLNRTNFCQFTVYILFNYTNYCSDMPKSPGCTVSHEMV